MQTESYGEFSQVVHKRMMGRRAAVEVSIEVTHRCPLECQHCYNNLPMADVQARKNELTFDEHVKLLDELVAAGCLWILYTGGEIFARKDFLNIYTEAKKRGFLITLFTNGTLINQRVADHLAQYPPFNIEITLYGATRETYESLTQIPGSFDRCMKGIHLLLERKLPLKLKTVPTTVNVHEVYEMKRIAEELGVEFKFDPLVNPRTDCSQSPLAVRLTPEDAVSLDFRDAVRQSEYKKLAAAEISAPLVPQSDQKYTCGGGQNGCAIDPGGKMTICVLSHKDGYQWREGNFQAGWSGRLKEIRESKRQSRTICADCRIKSLCSMCPANGELESGDAETPVEFLCQVAHLRAYSLDFEVPDHGNGNCPCCAGGIHHSQLSAAAIRIQNNLVDLQRYSPVRRSNSLLPVLQSAGASGGCGSCSSHRV